MYGLDFNLFMCAKLALSITDGEFITICYQIGQFRMILFFLKKQITLDVYMIGILSVIS